jgi:hypothetical protein
VHKKGKQTGDFLSFKNRLSGILAWLSSRGFAYIALFLIVFSTATLPFVISRQVSAAGQLTTRSLSISSGVPSKTGVQYTFSFILATLSGTSDVEGLKFQACTTPVGGAGGCSAPAGMDMSSATFVSQNGNWQGATNFAVDLTGNANCSAGANILCAKRTNTTNQTTSTARTITFGTITNPSAANTAFFLRISTYDNNTWSSSGGANNLLLDQGTTASAVVQTLTTSAQVAEVLNFCIGNTAADIDSAVMPSSCTAVTGTSVNLGVLNSSVVNVSPVATLNNGDNNNGLAMLRTNASNGATVAYDAIQASTGTNHLGTLRISSAVCNAGVVSTDACINAIGTTQSTITPGVEKFGITVAGVDCDSTSSYTCTFAGANYNLIRTTNYDGTGSNTYPTDADQVSGITNAGYAWDETGTPQIIAQSSTYVDDEALILKFAATSGITTPFGTYTVQTDFIAVPTY